MSPEFRPGERYLEQREQQGKTRSERGIGGHLGWRRTLIEPGRSEFEWEATTDHAFPAGDGWIVHGGMITALLDTAMGAATWSLLDRNEVFLTADLRTEFYRPTKVGLVRAKGWVVHKTRKISFAAAELFDEGGVLLASCRGTNVTLEIPRGSEPLAED